MLGSKVNLSFYFSVYKFCLLPEDTIKVPVQNKGSIIRGALGHGLRTLVCIDKNKEDCILCPMRLDCAYFMIFSPSEVVPIKRMRDTPRGFVIKPPLDLSDCYTPRFPLIFDLVLIGRHIDTLPWFIVALNNIGKIGVGYNKGQFSIGNILIWDGQKFYSIYDKDTKIVLNQQKKIILEDLTRGIVKEPTEVTLNFLTPTRIKYNPTGRKSDSFVVKHPEFHHIIRRLKDRISILSRIYCGEGLNIDPNTLVEVAKTIKTKSSDLKWHFRTRKSGTMLTTLGKKATQDQSGFTGTITFVGNLGLFIPLLLLGQYIHIGEDTTFGNGWYQVEFE